MSVQKLLSVLKSDPKLQCTGRNVTLHWWYS